MTRVRVRVAAIVVMVSSVTALAVAQTVETGFLNRSVSIHGVAFRYQVYVPATFNRTATWPVILALHGGGEYGDDGLRQTQGGIASAIRQHQGRAAIAARSGRCRVQRRSQPSLSHRVVGWRQRCVVSRVSEPRQVRGHGRRVWLDLGASRDHEWRLVSSTGTVRYCRPVRDNRRKGVEGSDLDLPW